MATIQSSIQLMDGMSKPLNSIINSINMTISALQRVNGTNVHINTSELLGAQAEIQRAGSQIRRIEDDITNSINAQVDAQNRLNASMNNGVSSASSLYSVIGKAAKIYTGFKSLISGINLADTITQNTARLNLMNDGNQSTSELQNMIYNSSKNSRGNYFSTLDSISKMGLTAGNAFNSNTELVGFMELINKQFKISGTSKGGIDAAMLQLTQAMGAGVLRGEELNSIFEQAPLIIKNIASYMNIPIGQIKSLAAEGKITSDIVKNAMFYAANDINQKFESIPTTFGDIVESFKRDFIKAYTPISMRLNGLFNSSDFQNFTQMLISGMTRFINLTVSGIDIVSRIANVMKNNWNVIAPIIGSVTFAILAYKSALIMANIELIKNNLLQAKNTIGTILLAGKYTYLAATTFAYTVAQEGLNAALLACPITWIVGGIMLLVGALYAGVAAFNAITGKSISATGIITGSIAGLVTSILNFGIILWNNFFSVAEAFVNVWKHPIYSVRKLFWDLVINILDLFDNFSGIIDKIVGTDYSQKIKDYRTSIQADLEIAKPKDYIDSNLKLNTFDTGSIMKTTYDKTANFTDNTFGKENILGMDETNKYLASISQNTSSMVEGLDASIEEIKYMRDIAEMEVINRFTTAEVKVEVGGITNQVNNEMDLDSVVTKITDKMYEGISTVAEGVYD